MKPRQPNYKNDFRNIREVLKTISKDISDIKKILNIKDELVSKVELKKRGFPPETRLFSRVFTSTH